MKFYRNQYDGMRGGWCFIEVVGPKSGGGVNFLDLSDMRWEIGLRLSFDMVWFGVGIIH